MLAKICISVKQPGIHFYENFCFPKLPSMHMRIACVQRIAAAAGVEGMRVGDPPLCIPPPPHRTQTQKLSPRSNKICTVSTIRYKTGCLIRICVSDLLLASVGSYTDYTLTQHRLSCIRGSHGNI